MSRFSFCAVSSSGASSSAPYLDHQSFWGQTGALLAIGAVKPGGTSPGRSSGVGLAVQAARLTASTLALTPRRKAPRNKDFIELSLPKWGGPAADYKFYLLRPRYRPRARKYGGRGPLGKAQAVKLCRTAPFLQVHVYAGDLMGVLAARGILYQTVSCSARYRFKVPGLSRLLSGENKWTAGLMAQRGGHPSRSDRP